MLIKIILGLAEQCLGLGWLAYKSTVVGVFRYFFEISIFLIHFTRNAFPKALSIYLPFQYSCDLNISSALVQLTQRGVVFSQTDQSLVLASNL